MCQVPCPVARLHWWSAFWHEVLTAPTCAAESAVDFVHVHREAPKEDRRAKLKNLSPVLLFAEFEEEFLTERDTESAFQSALETAVARLDKTLRAMASMPRQREPLHNCHSTTISSFFIKTPHLVTLFALQSNRNVSRFQQGRISNLQNASKRPFKDI